MTAWNSTLPQGKPLKRSPMPRRSKKGNQVAAHDARVKKAMLKAHGYYDQDDGEWCLCYFCGKPMHNPDACHLMPKQRFPELRYVLENVVPGHRTCHGSYDRHEKGMTEKVESTDDYQRRMRIIESEQGTIIK